MTTIIFKLKVELDVFSFAFIVVIQMIKNVKIFCDNSACSIYIFFYIRTQWFYNI